MHIDDLSRAVELQTELKQWREAEKRCQPSVFKHAILRVADAAHGHQGQNAETVINLDPDTLLPFIRAQIDRTINGLRKLGIET